MSQGYKTATEDQGMLEDLIGGMKDRSLAEKALAENTMMTKECSKANAVAIRGQRARRGLS